MAQLLGFLALSVLLVVAAAERISPSRSTSADRDSDWNYGFDAPVGKGSRAGSVNRGSSHSWTDDDAENDFSTPKITAWKGGVVPYEIASNISTSNAAALKKMFRDISSKTCVEFRPKTSRDSSYVFIKAGNKCSAPLGMSTATGNTVRGSWSSGSVSNVVLGQSCFTTKRVGRRVMNLLGLPHETSRPDRDQHVEIDMTNLRSGYASNIKQVATSAYLPGVLDVPYDLQSITQYSDDDLAKDASRWAIRTKSVRTRSQTLGGETFSAGDFEKIRKAYNCPRSGTGTGSRRN